MEGLETGETLSHLQQAFIEKLATQCGFCTPGFLVLAHALLAEHPDPSEEVVVDYLDGNICRCTGYRPIIEAILLAAERMRAGS